MYIRHILVTHQYEAEDLQLKLEKGAEFETLARQYSSCSSAKVGGDLGNLAGKKQSLDESFLEACQQLQVGQISPPIRTRFGYHFIQKYK